MLKMTKGGVYQGRGWSYTSLPYSPSGQVSGQGGLYPPSLSLYATVLRDHSVCHFFAMVYTICIDIDVIDCLLDICIAYKIYHFHRTTKKMQFWHKKKYNNIPYFLFTSIFNPWHLEKMLAFIILELLLQALLGLGLFRILSLSGHCQIICF